ncbi:Beta-barrel assembly machine subunit BamA [Archangium gephyra]|uniref:Beta-barrel assembly machine subunit BamA n=1 Tax=Archangium gephyra TaxID=48 RepID=A0AAC8QGT1_9BACT|nr:BamA/TamA family outer membrane protein [Archangium gephyra]AKJ07477.1 Outer membrane protein assembly factor YaeT precursor [Archangium gephyra]REG19125.1 Beta-barrel assembly machine subunit BamA [Archangium gephyra]
MDVADFRLRQFLRGTSLLLLLSAGCGTPSGATRPDQPKVVDLKIEGADEVKASDIKEKIVTSETPWWEPFNPFVGPNYFDENAWLADLRRIKRFYQSQGYYQVQLESEQLEDTVVRKGEDAVALRVKVRQEGEPTRVGTFEVKGMEALPPEHRARVLAELPLEPVRGDEERPIFREEGWEETKELMQQRLRELGYAEAEVSGEVQVDLATHEAKVLLEVRPGLRYRFGNIFVATDANPQVKPRRIIEQAQGAIRKGEWYSETALSEAQSRVFRMGVFGAVKVNRGAPDREARTVPVVVDVREAPFRSIRLGGGVGLDAARQEVRAVGEWTDRNFFGGLRRLTVGGRVGYAFIPDIRAAFDRLDTDGDGVLDAPNLSTPHGVVFELSTQFEQPRFLARDLRLQTTLTAERGLEQAYNFIGGRLRGGVIWQPYPEFSLFPSYNLEVYRLQGQRGLQDQTTVPPLVLGCPAGAGVDTCNISVSYLEQIAEWDRRDDPIAPRNGFYTALSLQEGGGPLQGDYDFLRVLPDVRGYYTFGDSERFTLAARLRLGTLLTPVVTNEAGERIRQESAIVNRFFAGGGASMRGFNSRRLSPMNRISKDANLSPSDQIVPIGGNSLVETSVELRMKVIGNLYLAAFHDTGLVGAGPLNFGSHQADVRKESGRVFGDYHYQAVGLGVRYVTIVGPLRLDLARRLNIGRPLPIFDPASGAPETLGGLGDCFGIGGVESTAAAANLYAGSPEGLCTFFLSIGEAF